MTERERLLKVMETEQMSAKQFAIEVGIQPGTISNICSGRNNPSLDVMQRVLNRFRTLSADWLILGIGQMYRQNGEMPAGVLFDIPPVMPEDGADVLPIIMQQNTSGSSGSSNTSRSSISSGSSRSSNTSNFSNTSATEKELPKPEGGNRQIQKVVIFYTDGTFEER